VFDIADDGSATAPLALEMPDQRTQTVLLRWTPDDRAILVPVLSGRPQTMRFDGIVVRPLDGRRSTTVIDRGSSAALLFPLFFSQDGKSFLSRTASPRGATIWTAAFNQP
jgi:hypothetical protein